jgi:hypothetical protein
VAYLMALVGIHLDRLKINTITSSQGDILYWFLLMQSRSGNSYMTILS